MTKKTCPGPSSRRLALPIFLIIHDRPSFSLKNDINLLEALVEAANAEVRKGFRSRDFQRHRLGTLSNNYAGDRLPHLRAALETILSEHDQWIPYHRITEGGVVTMNLPALNQLVEVCTRHRDRRLATLEHRRLALLPRMAVETDNVRITSHSDQPSLHFGDDGKHLVTLKRLPLGIPETGNIWMGDDRHRLYAGSDKEGHLAEVTHWRPLPALPNP